MISIKGLSVEINGKKIVSDINVTVENGDWLMIAGPNGAGKTTVINAVSRAVPYTGLIEVDGTDIRTMKSVELARKLGTLVQTHSVGYGFTVEEVIRMGLYARQGGFFSKGIGGGEERFREAVEETGMEPFLRQNVLTLSGGELQRAFLAQLFTQDPETLLLDEPTNHLDLVYQKQVFELVDEWRKRKNRLVISVVHDLSMARLFGTHALLLDRGRCAACGRAE
ncbi:MAG: ABC transporter ATP-binding protein, partial [Lachnospiraceae bacterium]|nr:ABC transporter ATP-binding protein [Lachnospiraceae bacterium]